jgi:vacuolar-type H+-ATPase subunit I/STV1
MNEYDWYFLGGVVVGVLLTLAWVAYRINSFINKLVEEVEKKINDIQEVQLVGIEVERGENGIIYCYGKEDKQFICQGATLQDIREAFTSRFPDKTCYIAGGDEQLIEELKRAIDEDKRNK